MEEILKLIRPELLALLPVLYAVGMLLKRIDTTKIPDWTIPLFVLGTGMLGALAYVLASDTDGITVADVFGALFQGLLLAVATVGVNQFVKQIAVKRKADENIEPEDTAIVVIDEAEVAEPTSGTSDNAGSDSTNT